jgi:adenine C2-methylase RlmN of 23S rRNA A2503 and tRNA A37
VNCQFCLTAKLGLQRNLTAGEIAGQVVAVLDRQGVEVGKDRVNLVFMGMGEPFLNYENFIAAVRLLVEEVGLSPQRMTVSTSGIVPGIERFAGTLGNHRIKKSEAITIVAVLRSRRAFGGMAEEMSHANDRSCGAGEADAIGGYRIIE